MGNPRKPGGAVPQRRRGARPGAVAMRNAATPSKRAVAAGGAESRQSARPAGVAVRPHANPHMRNLGSGPLRLYLCDNDSRNILRIRDIANAGSAGPAPRPRRRESPRGPLEWPGFRMFYNATFAHGEIPTRHTRRLPRAR